MTVKETSAPVDPTSQIFEAIKQKFNSEHTISLKCVRFVCSVWRTCQPLFAMLAQVQRRAGARYPQGFQLATAGCLHYGLHGNQRVVFEPFPHKADAGSLMPSAQVHNNVHSQHAVLFCLESCDEDGQKLHQLFAERPLTGAHPTHRTPATRSCERPQHA